MLWGLFVGFSVMCSDVEADLLESGGRSTGEGACSGEWVRMFLVS